MKVLVTGAGGFIGSHLTEQLVREGHDVRAFVRYNSNGSIGWLNDSDITKEIEVVKGDIRDFDSVYKAALGCDEIFHLAALIGIPYSYVSPQAYIKTNIEGTYNVLEAGKLLNTKKIIITSTSETYGTAQFVPISESHPLVGQSPYSASKIGADQLGISYFRSFNLPVFIVRPFNTFGPRQSTRAVIPTIISQLLMKDTIKLGSLTPTRDYTYVEDTASGFIAIASSDGLAGSPVNIGMGFEVSIGKIVEMISDFLGKEIKIDTDDNRIRPAKSEVERLFCDNTVILNNTDWRPKYNFEDGLRNTLEWFRGRNDLNWDNYHV